MPKPILVKEAKQIFESYLENLRHYSIKAYENFTDDAEVTSTRQNIMTLRWTGRKIKDHIQPSLDHARKAGRLYKLLGDVSYIKDAGTILISGRFESTSIGHTGEFYIRVARGSDRSPKIVEYHDGKPVEDAIRFEKISQKTSADGTLEIHLKPKTKKEDRTSASSQ